MNKLILIKAVRRNVKRTHVGRHGQAIDYECASDRLVDNRILFRAKFKTMEEWGNGRC